MFEKAPKWAWGLVIGIATVFFMVGVWWIKSEKPPAEARVAVATQIYPNYTFEEGVNQIRVPLISVGQQLTREAGGWVITPAGSAYRNDYEIPITIEYIDGRKFYREPNKPAWDGVIPANSIFRLYGKEGEYATVTIKRGVY
ncbi:hypothetical protein GW888_02065 [Candidatus Wolfebacteria bacterium]|nr:hypothetical protein [Candidatus Wolfebacteria bacterium]